MTYPGPPNHTAEEVGLKFSYIIPNLVFFTLYRL